MTDGRGSSSFEEAHFHRRAEATPINNYDGFSNLKAYLKQQKAQGCENVPRLMLKYSKVDAPTQPSTANMFPPKANEDRQFPHNEITGVSFVYENIPLPGWRKELVLRIVGNSAGRIEVYYANPTREKRFRSRQELQTYLEAEIMKTNPNNTNPNNVSLIIHSTLNNFDFKPVFCVCQCSEDPFRNYVECSYGKIGCSKWIHPECVGLGSRSKTELDSFPKVICPFCTIYLRGCGYDSFVPNRIKLLDQFSTRFELHDTYLEPDNELIEETNCPHRIWGLDDFTLTYYHESEIVGDAVKGGGKGLSSSSLPQTASHADIDKKSSRTAANTSSSSSNNNTSNQVLLYHSDQHISKWRRKIYDETKEKMIMVGVVGGYAVTEDDQPDNQIMRNRIQQRILEKQRQSQETERKRLFTTTGSHYHSVNSVIGLKRGANTSSSSLHENNSYYYPPPAPPVIHYKTNLDELICRSFLNYQLNKKRNFITNQHLFNIAPIAYHNQEEGGIRIITTVTSTRSLHDLCKSGLCGLCLQPLLLPSTTMTATSAVTSGNGKGKKNKKATDEGNNAADVTLTVPLTEICNFGAVSYELHRHCAFLLNHEGELLNSIMKQFPHLSTKPSPPPSSSSNDLNKQEASERRQEEEQGGNRQEKKEDNHTTQTEEENVVKQVDEENDNSADDHQVCCDEYGCKINRYYYDDIDDAKCDDCQKPGAVLLTWDTSKSSYNLHLLCLFHLIRRKWLLNRQKNFIALEEEEREKNIMIEDSNDTAMIVEEVRDEVMFEERVQKEEEENESKQVDASSAMEVVENDEVLSQIKDKEPNETIIIIDDGVEKPREQEKQEEPERERETEGERNSLKVESVSTNIEVIDLIDSPSVEKEKIEEPETTERKNSEEGDKEVLLNQSPPMETIHVTNDHPQVSNHTAASSTLPSSSFVEDFSVLHCRCMICGSHDGRIIRCCGANCHIRAHLICASYTKEWKIITLHNPSIISKNKKNHQKDKAVVKAIGFVCSTHRIFDSTVEDEEEIDYFKK